METFVVRVFLPVTGGETPIAGVVEHVGTSWSGQFGTDAELLKTIRSWLEREHVPLTVARTARGMGRED
jgi:hypothetical protein